MPKKILTVISDEDNYQEPKFLFGNRDREYLTIVTMRDVINKGGPVVADGYEDEGDDYVLIGQVDSSYPTGDVDTNLFTL